MGFKLGNTRGLQANSGEIKQRFSFHKSDASVPGTPVIRKELENGIMGEANMDGTIYISDKLEPGSQEERLTLLHEMRHATDIKLKTLEYGDDYIRYQGTTYPRETINGKDMINIHGEWKEAGDHDFPWENDANNGN